MGQENYHILLIEDSAAYAKLIKSILSESRDPTFSVSRAPTLKAGLEALANGGVDLALLDLTLPDGEGIDSFRRVRAVAGDTPIIVLTGLDNDDVANTTLREGAQDYLNKREISHSAVLRCARYAIDRHRAEMSLVQARKMESIGHLAAGLAHEINTPIQYLGDSLAFLRTGFEDLRRLREDFLALCVALETGSDPGALLETIRRRRVEIELKYLEEEVPKALDRALVGLRRVSGVVQAMREFSHPSAREKEYIDLNRAIENSLTIASAQYRYIADFVTELGPIPQVKCHGSEINQALLNLIVNAAQAVESAGKQGDKGVILVRSLVEGDSVRVEVCDTGVGIRDEIRRKVFDPFFTTKPVGRGTGQGLALAHASIVTKHGGRLDFENRPTGGTKFWFSLPVRGDSEDEA